MIKKKPGTGLMLTREEAMHYGPRGARGRERGMTYMIEGEQVSTGDIASRLGVHRDTALVRLKKAQKTSEAVTWKSLGVKT